MTTNDPDTDITLPSSDDEHAAQIAQLTDQLKRAQADYMNLKRRTEEEQSAFAQFAYTTVLSKVLPVLDTLERAVQHVPADLEKNEWTVGIVSTIKQFHDILMSMGVAPIASVGQPVDPALHEVLMTAPGEKDIVLQELEKGYLFRDKVLRPAKVSVGKG